jgi:hypothetical protein
MNLETTLSSKADFLPIISVQPVMRWSEVSGAQKQAQFVVNVRLLGQRDLFERADGIVQ